MIKKIIFYWLVFILVISNCFCGDLDKKFEEILSRQRIQNVYENSSSNYFTDSKIKQIQKIKILSSKKIILSTIDKNFYYISWYSPSEPDIIVSHVYELSSNELLEQSSIWISKLKTNNIGIDTIFDVMDHEFPGFLQKPNFFKNYVNSVFFYQCEKNRIANTLSYFIDIDNDGNEEIFTFESVAASDIYTSAIIYKYINNEWKEIFHNSYFGWEDFWDNENYTKKEWYNEKKFPYDFVEYKGKIGLRIICYDQPKDWPTQYHAQFWYFDSDTQKYEMLEEIWNTEEDTPSDGLIFVEARTNLFSQSRLDFSKLDTKLTDTYVMSLDKKQLRIMRNAVYARHGRSFKSADLQSLWESYTWYKKNPNYNDSLLTDIDKYNIELIQKYEAK